MPVPARRLPSGTIVVDVAKDDTSGRIVRKALSGRFTTGAFGLSDTDQRHVKLPRIGVVRTHESTRKLVRTHLPLRPVRSRAGS